MEPSETCNARQMQAVIRHAIADSCDVMYAGQDPHADHKLRLRVHQQDDDLRIQPLPTPWHEMARPV